MIRPNHTRFEDLPRELAVFPLGGALLLPWGRLPLNIFEPRYLTMIMDCLKTGRVFGMIQPDSDKTPPNKTGDDKIIMESEPTLYSVGCAGRVSSFEETEDGRLLIMLKGLARFRVLKEVEGQSGYRRLQVSYDEFKADMETPAKVIINRDKLLTYLKPYLEGHNIPVSFDVIRGLSDNTLVTSLCMICPFDPREKQALLEAVDMNARATALTMLLQMGVFDAGGSADGPKQ